MGAHACRATARVRKSERWWEPGESCQAWALLGAIGEATEGIGIGTGVTAPVHRYNPAVVAQLAATMEEMCPAGRISASARGSR